MILVIVRIDHRLCCIANSSHMVVLSLPFIYRALTLEVLISLSSCPSGRQALLSPFIYLQWRPGWTGSSV